MVIVFRTDGKTREDLRITQYADGMTVSFTDVDYNLEGQHTKTDKTTYASDGTTPAEQEVTIYTVYPRKLSYTKSEYDAEGSVIKEEVTWYTSDIGRPYKRYEITYSNNVPESQTYFEINAAGIVTRTVAKNFASDGETVTQEDATWFQEDGITPKDREVTVYWNGVRESVTKYDFHAEGTVAQTILTKYDSDGETVAEYDMTWFKEDGATPNNRFQSIYISGRISYETDYDFHANGNVSQTQPSSIVMFSWAVRITSNIVARKKSILLGMMARL